MEEVEIEKPDSNKEKLWDKKNRLRTLIDLVEDQKSLEDIESMIWKFLPADKPVEADEDTDEAMESLAKGE